MSPLTFRVVKLGVTGSAPVRDAVCSRFSVRAFVGGRRLFTPGIAEPDYVTGKAERVWITWPRSMFVTFVRPRALLTRTFSPS